MTVTLGRPLAASLLLAGGLVVALSAIGASWADLSSAGEERDAKADLLARSVAASRRAKLAPAAAEQADPFVAAATETLAAAQVDALVRAVAGEAGASLLSSRAEVKPDDSGPPGRIEAQAVIEGQNEAFQAILLKLERGAPMMLVDETAIELAETAVGGDPQAPRLRMSLTLSAFWRPSHL